MRRGKSRGSMASDTPGSSRSLRRGRQWALRARAAGRRATPPWRRHPLAFPSPRPRTTSPTRSSISRTGCGCATSRRNDLLESPAPRFWCEARIARCPALEPVKRREDMLDPSLRACAPESRFNTLIHEVADVLRARRHDAILAGAFDQALVRITSRARSAVQRHHPKRTSGSVLFPARDGASNSSSRDRSAIQAGLSTR